MREILFRGKRIDDDKWTYGYLFKCWGRCYLLWGMNGDNPIKEEVIPETVGQFTGLYDKNGKKIFEGDIVSSNKRKTWIGRGKVWFDKGVFWCGEREWAKLLRVVCLEDEQAEVIGNIHDNPEILEE